MTSWAHNAIQAANCLGTLSLGGVSMNRDAWSVLNIGSLWEPAPKRGENLLIPFRPGRMQLARMRDQRTDTLDLLVVGTVDVTGVPTADPYEGLEANIDWLNDNVFDYAETMFSFSATLTKPSGIQWGAQLQIESVKFGWEVGVACTATIDYTLPEGRFTRI